ncbi:hypothetical protein C9374_007693 [Naegleria lovaniensis]|uniref:Uncharacterized protein n=1 Tax=Naegleria lovaniensis TaxID=51637 RepID=A0AA88GLN7_NAELO|nr:uncharacterized protein C9374_007693 [Naegleria lovaniensis]KAG2379055.1 hypothetical protein C9374_007693 [Naegleria lovaniensis]
MTTPSITNVLVPSRFLITLGFLITTILVLYERQRNIEKAIYSSNKTYLTETQFVYDINSLSDSKEARSNNPFDTNIFKSSTPMSHDDIISQMSEKDKESFPSLKLEIEVNQTPIDEFMKSLEVVAYHPKTGKKISQKVILPLHPQLTLNIDDLNIDLAETSLTPKNEEISTTP